MVISIFFTTNLTPVLCMGGGYPASLVAKLVEFLNNEIDSIK